MAKFKKTAGKTAGKTTGKSANRGTGNAKAQAERLSNTLSESAQQIWLAGVGAFGLGRTAFAAAVTPGRAAAPVAAAAA